MLGVERKDQHSPKVLFFSKLLPLALQASWPTACLPGSRPSQAVTCLPTAYQGHCIYSLQCLFLHTCHLTTKPMHIFGGFVTAEGHLQAQISDEVTGQGDPKYSGINKSLFFSHVTMQTRSVGGGLWHDVTPGRWLASQLCRAQRGTVSMFQTVVVSLPSTQEGRESPGRGRSHFCNFPSPRLSHVTTPSCLSVLEMQLELSDLSRHKKDG